MKKVGILFLTVILILVVNQVLEVVTGDGKAKNIYESHENDTGFLVENNIEVTRKIEIEKKKDTELSPIDEVPELYTVAEFETEKMSDYVTVGEVNNLLPLSQEEKKITPVTSENFRSKRRLYVRLLSALKGNARLKKSYEGLNIHEDTLYTYALMEKFGINGSKEFYYEGANQLLEVHGKQTILELIKELGVERVRFEIVSYTRDGVLNRLITLQQQNLQDSEVPARDNNLDREERDDNLPALEERGNPVIEPDTRPTHENGAGETIPHNVDGEENEITPQNVDRENETEPQNVDGEKETESQSLDGEGNGLEP